MPPAGLEPATLWLEATRAIRLRHTGKLIFILLILFFIIKYLFLALGLEPKTFGS